MRKTEWNTWRRCIPGSAEPGSDRSDGGRVETRPALVVTPEDEVAWVKVGDPEGLIYKTERSSF